MHACRHEPMDPVAAWDAGTSPATVNRPHRRRVLFVVQAAGEADLRRTAALASALDRSAWEVVIAAPLRLRPLLAEVPGRLIGIAELSPARQQASRLLGLPVGDRRDLAAEVEEDRALIAAERPDVVVGDQRPSLSVSARLALVPYVAVAEAAASPFVPRLPWGGSVAGQLVQRLLAPVEAGAAVQQLAREVRAVCAERGVQPLWTGGAAGVLTDGEGVALAAPEGWLDAPGAPEHHAWVGALRWSAPAHAPAWLPAVEAGRPWIHISLGEGQDPALLARVVRVLAGLGHPLTVATAGVRLDGPLPDGVHAAVRLPEDRLVAGAALVVGDGADGGLAALAAGVPVLGLAGTEAQVVALRQAERQGCARCLRRARLTDGRLLAAARALLDSPLARAAAARVQRRVAAYPPGERFAALLDRVLMPAYC